jgi:hypothetical protein
MAAIGSKVHAEFQTCKVLRHDRECDGDAGLIEDVEVIAGAFPIC